MQPKVNNESNFAAFHASSLCECLKYPPALNASSTSVTVSAKINQQLVDDMSVDAASDVPCIAEQNVRAHPTLK